MYLESIKQQYIESSSKRIIRRRWQEGYETLYKLYGREFDPKSLNSGYKYSFASILAKLIPKMDVLEELRAFDCLILTHWTPDYDPDIPDIAPYLTYRYKIECPIYDLVDRGNISPIISLKLIKLLLSSSSEKIGLLVLEQNTVSSVTTSQKIPHCGVGLISLTKEIAGPANSRLRILDVYDYNEESALSTRKEIVDTLLKHPNDPKIIGICADNPANYKIIRALFHEKNDKIATKNISGIRRDQGKSALDFFEDLNRIKHEPSELSHIFFEFVDSESSSMAAVLIQRRS